MNKDIKINKKQFKLLAIEVVLHNLKTNYDRRNRFDDHVVRYVVDHFIEDGYKVIMNPVKSIKQVEDALERYDGYDHALKHYEYLYTIGIAEADMDTVTLFGDKKRQVFSDKKLTETFESSYPYRQMMKSKISK